MSLFSRGEGAAFESALVCDIGGRERNEDYAAYRETKDRGFYALCDGLGGHRGGDEASETAAEAFLMSITEAGSVSSEAVAAATDFAQKTLLEKFGGEQRSGALSPRTTGAFLALGGDKAYVCNIGDSRVYHMRGGKIEFVTNDHSVAYLSYLSGEIEYDDIRTSPDQNRLIRSMGDNEKYNPEFAAPIDIESGDAFLLCSDGFWEYVVERDMESTLKASKTPSRWLAKMVRIHAANTKGIKDNDNFSAITVFVN